jgi:DNA-binding transcriptional regulator LsrR (DeoR family)
MAGNRDREPQALAAAMLASQGMLQKDVADKLALSQPEISRLLRLARERGWLREAPTLNREQIDADLMQRVQQKYFSRPQLAERIAELAPDWIQCRLHVVTSKGEETFGPAAAEPVGDILRNARKLGVMWGRTIATVIEGLEVIYGEPPHAADPIGIIPLCGEPLFAANRNFLEYSSSFLARRLARLLNGERYQGPLMTGIPAYIPTSFSPAEMRAVRKFIEMIPGYQSIYGKLGEIASLDTVFTGMGILDSEDLGDWRTGVFLQERLALEPINAEELDGLVYGEIGGALIERRDLSAADLKRVERLKRGWMGFTEEQLRTCASGSKRGSAGCGVIAVASGVRKASLVIEVVERGLVNELVVDEALAGALEECLQPAEEATCGAPRA